MQQALNNYYFDGIPIEDVEDAFWDAFCGREKKSLWDKLKELIELCKIKR